MNDKSKTPGYKPGPIRVKLNNKKKCDILQENVKLLFEFLAAINLSSCLHRIMHETIT